MENIRNVRQNQKEVMKERRTEKKDKEYHGYGRQNMKAVAEKYNGSLLFEEKKGEFTVKIHLEEKKTFRLAVGNKKA